jgi:LacI family transcriptional regulator
MHYKRVYLGIDRRRAYCRGVLRGIYRYMLPKRQWVCLKNTQPNEAAYWDVKGTLADIDTEELVRGLATLEGPVVNTSFMLDVPGIPRVGVDDDAVGEMAAEYFLKRNFRNFAFYSRAAWAYTRPRREAFARRLALEGCQCHQIEFLDTKDRRYHDNLVAWLRDLPKPIALFAGDDVQGQYIVETCFIGGVNVPEELAVLGVDDDELLCDESFPPLSSIQLPLEKIGYESARLLDSLMRGKPAPTSPTLFAPVAVVTRASSDILAIEDPDLAAAIRFIRDNAQHPLSINDVLEHVPASRRTLECRFRQILGRTILQEIHATRLDRAKSLLAQTDLRIPEVAAAAGFSNNMHLHRLFRSQVGMTLTAYRNRYRCR